MLGRSFTRQEDSPNGDESNQTDESVVTILARYSDIQENLPDELLSEPLPYFMDWLIENVHLVEITAYSDQDAYTIFETMNDRGLSLAPADMLKGYLLAKITDQGRRNAASAVWKERVAALLDIGKDEDADGIKSWLRSQYAESIRERKRGATPLDLTSSVLSSTAGCATARSTFIFRRAQISPASLNATSPFTRTGTSGSGTPLAVLQYIQIEARRFAMPVFAASVGQILKTVRRFWCREGGSNPHDPKVGGF